MKSVKRRTSVAVTSAREHSASLDSRSQDELVRSLSHKDSKPIPHNADPSLPLYAMDQVPPYVCDNKYILKYYRAYYSTSMCIRSVLRLHNESLNIWTHLVGGVLFIAFTIYLFHSLLLPEYYSGNVLKSAVGDGGLLRKVRVPGESTRLPLLIFGFYSFGCVMCMTCSACFHTFIGHMSERLYRHAHALDYFGITFLVVGSFLPFCYYVFSCLPLWRNVYLTMISLFGVVGLLGPFFRRWTSTAFATKKILFYVCMVGSGIFPIVHMALFLPEDTGSPYVKGLLAMMFLYGIGVFIYAFKIPEIFFPGKFDLFFSSHQIFHICVLGAALTHFFNCVDMYTNFDKMVCTPH